MITRDDLIKKIGTILIVYTIVQIAASAIFGDKIIYDLTFFSLTGFLIIDFILRLGLTFIIARLIKLIQSPMIGILILTFLSPYVGALMIFCYLYLNPNKLLIDNKTEN